MKPVKIDEMLPLEEYERRVQKLIGEGLTRSDAQNIVDLQEYELAQKRKSNHD